MGLDIRLGRELAGVRLWLGLAIFLGFVIGVLIVVQALLLSRIIAAVFPGGAGLDRVGGDMVALLVTMLVRAGLAWGSDISAFRAAARVKLDLRERLFQHLILLGPAFARGERTGELINTAVEGIEALEAYLSQYVPQLALAALVPLAILFLVFPVDLLSGTVLLLTGPLIPLFMFLIGKAADALTRRQWTSLSFLSAHFLDVLQGLTTLKILGRSREQIRTIAQVSDRFRVATMSVLRVALLSAFALEMIATISTAIVAVQVGLRLLYGHLQFEQALFVLVLAPDFYLPLRLLGTRFHAGTAGLAAAQRIFEILETPGGALRRPLSTPVPLSPAVSRASPPSIVFDGVHYAYAGERAAALDGVSFTIAPGRQVALVGPTGSGKSTAVNLLLRFIEPDQGEIICEGVPLRDWSPEDWRARVAWVPQHPYLFDDTVAANIRLARPGASMEEVVRAAELSHADEFIHALPRGYATVIGERGARLSGGEAQRIALARAFLKDAPVLILDEPMSQLDVENAAWVHEAIDRLRRDRTALIVTHRLNLAASADQVVVLREGRVAECGAPLALLRQGGPYHRLVTAGANAGEA